MLRYLVVERTQRIAVVRLPRSGSPAQSAAVFTWDCDGARLDPPAAEATRLLLRAERPSVFAGSWLLAGSIPQDAKQVVGTIVGGSEVGRKWGNRSKASSSPQP